VRGATGEPDLERQFERTTTDERGDSALLRLVQSGDDAALATLYDRHAGAAYGLALRITGDAGSAEDAVQEAFISMWKQAPRFDPERGQVRSWLLTIVHHKSIDAVRRRSNRPERQLPEGADEFLEATRGGPEDAAVWALEAEAVRNAMRRIPEEQRLTVEMAYFRGMTHVEIAAEMGVPLGTVKSRLRIAMEKMREYLQPKVLE
jgi:RNA polymerase sigma-70 factor (ECF subfamily)